MPAEGDWQARALTIMARGARGIVPGSLTALRDEHLAVIVPGADEALAQRAAQAVLRSLEDAMPGFAVVAGEVKNLASQTAKATEEIQTQIGAVQSATQSAARSNGESAGSTPMPSRWGAGGIGPRC